MTETKEHILKTTLQLFLQKNFKEVTMKEIVEATGLSKGAFYHYFSSKEQVFKEVIQNFLIESDVEKNGLVTKMTLKDFYTDLLKNMDKDIKQTKQMLGEKQNSYNFFLLIFDAIKMFPDFKEKKLSQNEAELKIWTSIIKNAKNNKEIQTNLADNEIAKLFIYIGDGLGISLILKDNVSTQSKELKTLWDALYSTLKN